nr:outer membrane beta-barrel family protein [Pedobacter sp. Leaf194]
MLGNHVDNVFAVTKRSSKSQNNTDNKIDLISIKADYTQKLGKANLESGVKFSSSETANLLQGVQTATDNSQIFQKNDFNYAEKIMAAYLSLERTFGKINVQAGLRGEYTNMNGLSIDELGNRTAKPDTSYLNLFPTFFFRYQINENNSIGLTYNRRLGRPSFQDQNPYLYRTDFYYASRGNPLLLPQFTQSVELDYTFNGQRQLKLSYSTTADLIDVIRIQQGDQTLELPVNAGRRSFLNMSLSTPFKLFRAWSGYFSAEPYYQFYKADLSRYPGLTTINQGGVGFNSYLSNTVELGKGWKAGLSAWFNYASRSSIYETKPIYSVDFTLKKPLFKERINCSLAMRDIFDTQKWTQNAVIGNVSQRNSRKWESRGLYVGLNYNFGNKKVKALSGKEKTEEQGRIKSRG